MSTETLRLSGSAPADLAVEAEYAVPSSRAICLELLLRSISSACQGNDPRNAAEQEQCLDGCPIEEHHGAIDVLGYRWPVVIPDSWFLHRLAKVAVRSSKLYVQRSGGCRL